MTRTTQRILVTGACGQIGSELIPILRERYGTVNVVATDIRSPETACLRDEGPFEQLDVCNQVMMDSIIDRYNIDTVYHMAAILSATGEEKPTLAWDVNISGLVNVLEIARKRKLFRIFCPSSIAVFGPDTPHDCAPQTTILTPTTMYGVTKVTGELLAEYYVQRFGLDIRGVRYPGIISSETLPGGGTTDYAVDIFYQALQSQAYSCFVRSDTVLPMMYMPDCIKATIDLMDADFNSLRSHCNFNLAGMSFSAHELAAEIQKHIPGFVCQYEPDFRQAIADSWPQTIDDSPAREEWGWQPNYDLESMTADMIEKLRPRLLAHS
ncbi:NAD-dependent epimerase/dehydratase family protein [Candidatus Bipolaricaulota bacterium]|nr:NAD-dependent epimerase/dehydratase family protein [Candidatus Bipolaricaulota bacterium]